MLSCFFGGAPSLGGLSVAIIFGQIAVLTQALAIVEPVVVRAGPCLLCAATPVITVDAHVLSIVLALFVRALLADADRRKPVTVFLNSSIYRFIVSLSCLRRHDLNGLAALGISRAPTIRIDRVGDVSSSDLLLGAGGGVVARVLLR